MNEAQVKFCDYYLIHKDIEKTTENVDYNKSTEYLTNTSNVKNCISEDISDNLENDIFKNKIAGESEILECLTEIMRGENQKASVKEQLKAAELLGKSYSIFSNKQKKESNEKVIIFGENEILE